MIVTFVRQQSLPAVNRARVWLDGRSSRERVLLGILAFWAGVAFFWYVVLGPLLSANAEARDRIALYEQLQARLRIAPGDAAAASAGPTMAEDAALDAALGEMAPVLGLAPEIAADGDRVQVTIANARFDSVVPFVQAIERGGGVVEAMRMDATEQAGLVNLTMTVSRR